MREVELDGIGMRRQIWRREDNDKLKQNRPEQTKKEENI